MSGILRYFINPRIVLIVCIFPNLCFSQSVSGQKSTLQDGRKSLYAGSSISFTDFTTDFSIKFPTYGIIAGFNFPVKRNFESGISVSYNFPACFYTSQTHHTIASDHVHYIYASGEYFSLTEDIKFNYFSVSSDFRFKIPSDDLTPYFIIRLGYPVFIKQNYNLAYRMSNIQSYSDTILINKLHLMGIISLHLGAGIQIKIQDKYAFYGELQFYEELIKAEIPLHSSHIDLIPFYHRELMLIGGVTASAGIRFMLSD